MVTFLIIIGRVPAIMRFRDIFSDQKVIFVAPRRSPFNQTAFVQRHQFIGAQFMTCMYD